MYAYILICVHGHFANMRLRFGLIMMKLPPSKHKLNQRKILAPVNQNISMSSSAMSGQRTGSASRYRSSIPKVILLVSHYSFVFDFVPPSQGSHHLHSSCATFLFTTRAPRRRLASYPKLVILSRQGFPMVRGIVQKFVVHRPSSERRRSPLSTTAIKIPLVFGISDL
jgi:hypothetical protein